MNIWSGIRGLALEANVPDEEHASLLPNILQNSLTKLPVIDATAEYVPGNDYISPTYYSFAFS